MKTLLWLGAGYVLYKAMTTPAPPALTTLVGSTGTSHLTVADTVLMRLESGITGDFPQTLMQDVSRIF